MGAIFSKILATTSEPTTSPILPVEGDITCCICEESSDDEPQTPFRSVREGAILCVSQAVTHHSRRGWSIE